MSSTEFAQYEVGLGRQTEQRLSPVGLRNGFYHEADGFKSVGKITCAVRLEKQPLSQIADSSPVRFGCQYRSNA